MKPRNKFQQKAVEASKKLPPLTPAQERWAYTKVIESVGQRTRKGVVTCLDCGNEPGRITGLDCKIILC